MAEIRAVVSHPSKQGNMYRVPMGAAASGIPTRFLTGFYYKPGHVPFTMLALLPRERRRRVEEKLERRRLAEMDPALVVQVSGPLPELCYGWFKDYRIGNAIHDRLAVRWLARHVGAESRGIFHGFQESCARSLCFARSRGLTAMLESTLPPSTMPLVAAEYRRLGVPWPGPSQPSGELLAELPRADFHIAQSAFAERSLIEHGVEPGRIFRMPLGVDAARFRPAEGPRPPGPFRALFAGHMSVRKGVHHLLAGWQGAALKEAELVFVGVPKDKYILDLVARQPAGIRYLGFVPNARLHETYQSADVFVFPSLAEGGVYVIYEALACGLPCIVSANAGSAVRDGIEGFVVPVGDSEAIADRLRRLAEDEELRRRMSAAARIRGQSFAWPEFYRRIGLMYREAVAREGRPAPGPVDMFER
ncbi:MAG TPA: glycosyltransferase family 4 protein [Dongiaceae bacterium]|nr:glycosyltransferase family 4 protein [Dongiaceae bacterium]